MAEVDDDRLVSLLTRAIGESVGFSNSKLSRERDEVQRYIEGERPHKSHPGDSKYCSMDVWDGVESMRACLMEVFSGNSRPVNFSPMNGEDTAAAQIRTDYCTNVLFSQNEGFSILQTVISDGLTNRAGVAKVYWDEKKTVDHYDLADTSYAEVAAFLSKNPGAEIKEITGDEMGQKFKRVRLSVPKDRSQVRVEPLPPEQFGISPMAKSIEDADMVFHRQPMSVSTMIKSGYDKAKVMDLQDSDHLWETTEPEVVQRFQQTDEMIGMRGLEDGQKATREIMVYECYIELSADDEDGIAQLTKVIMAGDVILHQEPVDIKPFVAFIPLPRAHAFWGMNYGKMLIPTQNARTYLTRSIINHTLMTNNPRLMVVKGAVKNPRELMENRFGGLVNVSRPDGIIPLPQAGLNPYVFQTRQILGEDKEQITGISALSQGLNKDAISQQNSQGMVQDLISVSQTRQRIIARNFAENFLRPLYTLIYKLVVQNEDRQKIVQVTGKWIPVDFTQWPETTEMEVSFSLGLNENAKEAEKWTQIDHYMSQDPDLKLAYPPPKRFNVISKIFNALGVKDPTDYILTPDQIQPPPPDPLHMADIAVKQADAKAKLASAQAVQMKAQLDLQSLQMKSVDANAKIQLQTTKATGELQLKQDALAHKVATDAAQLRLEMEIQQAATNESATAVAKPT